MRTIVLALAGLLVSVGSAAAQRPAWYLTGSVAMLRFSGAASAVGDADDESLTLRPSPRLGWTVGIARRSGSWSVGAAVGYDDGAARIDGEAFDFTDHSTAFGRIRLMAPVERRAARLGAGELWLGLAPSLDVWDALGETRAMLGADARVVVDVPLGGVLLRNFLAAGLSGNPLDEEGADGAERSGSLGWLSAGIGLAIRL